MNKIFLFAAGMLFTIQTYSQKIDFGMAIGYLNVNASYSAGDWNDSDNVSGFYLGFLADIALSEAIYLQASVNYGNAQKSNLLSIPILAKYYIPNSRFNLLAGPQATILLDQHLGPLKTFGMDLGFGAGYDLNENFFLQAKYFFEVTNRKDGLAIGTHEGLEIKNSLNTLFVGVGFKY